MATNPLTDPDPRTSADDDEDASEGVSSPEPAEGGDHEAAERPGSPKG